MHEVFNLIQEIVLCTDSFSQGNPFVGMNISVFLEILGWYLHRKYGHSSLAAGHCQLPGGKRSVLEYLLGYFIVWHY